jgi:hypothetical protein
MLYDSPQFVAAVRKIIRDLLGRAEPTVDSDNTQRNTDRERGDTPIAAVAELRTQTPIRVQIKAEDSKAERIWKIAKGGLEVLGILAVIIYTVLANKQWHEMIAARRQNQQAIEQATRAADAAKEEAELNKHVLEGADAAEFSFEGFNHERDEFFDVVIENTGHVASPNIDVTYSIVSVRIPDEKIVKVLEKGHFNKANVIPSKDRDEHPLQPQFRIPGSGQFVEKPSITFGFKGTFVYRNGFEDRDITEDFCWVIIPPVTPDPSRKGQPFAFYNHWNMCDRARAELDLLVKERAKQR